MARCEVCGNEYDKSFEVVMSRESHVFDSSNVLSMRWHPRAHLAAAKLSDMV